MNENHGGGKFAKRTGNNRKADKRYDSRVTAYNRTVAESRTDVTRAFHKPGSRKKVY